MGRLLCPEPGANRTETALHGMTCRACADVGSTLGFVWFATSWAVPPVDRPWNLGTGTYGIWEKEPGRSRAKDGGLMLTHRGVIWPVLISGMWTLFTFAKYVRYRCRRGGVALHRLSRFRSPTRGDPTSASACAFRSLSDAPWRTRDEPPGAWGRSFPAVSATLAGCPHSLIWLSRKARLRYRPHRSRPLVYIYEDRLEGGSHPVPVGALNECACRAWLVFGVAPRSPTGLLQPAGVASGCQVNRGAGMPRAAVVFPEHRYPPPVPGR